MITVDSFSARNNVFALLIDEGGRYCFAITSRCKLERGCNDSVQYDKARERYYANKEWYTSRK